MVADSTCSLFFPQPIETYHDNRSNGHLVDRENAKNETSLNCQIPKEIPNNRILDR